MTAPRLFGTDGVRGAFGKPPLDRPTVTALGAEVGVMLAKRDDDRAPRVVLGGDTRDSTPTLCRWLAAGLARSGCRAHYAGVLPTPGIAVLTRRLGAAAGVAVSASHNPHPDNGIKLIDELGFKWSAEAEHELETAILAHQTRDDGGEAPELTADRALARSYLDELAAAAPAKLEGLTVALDTAHGAAVDLAPELFRGLGAEVVTLGDAPDGENINRGCGSTRPEEMARRVAAAGCDLGFAFDGDADRVIPADENGRLWDGDALLYLLAGELAATGELDPPRIVATTMSNLGLEVALAERGVGIERCDVGDRVVVATLRRERLRLGGEQSGHIIDLARATSGDGMLTALTVAGLVARSGRRLSELLNGFRRFPQVLLNVEVSAKPDLGSLPAVVHAAESVERELGEHGRLVLRYSGTEPLARVMIEGPDATEVQRLAESLANVIREEIGA